MEKYGRVRQVTDYSIITAHALACWITKARIQTPTQNMSYSLFFDGKGGYANAP